MTPDLTGILKRMADATGLHYYRTDFEGRLRIQKTIYLLKAFGYTGAGPYHFNLYVRGPYSPGLARAYYNLSTEDVERRPPSTIPDRFLKPTVEAVSRGLPFLEILSTLHFFADRRGTRSKEDLFSQVRWAKRAWGKTRLNRHLEEAWAFLDENGLLPGRT